MKKITLKSIFFFAILTSYLGIAQDPSVLILGAPGNPAWADDVETKLESTGELDADIVLIGSTTPTLAELQAYDALFLFTDAGAADPVTLGDNIAAYIDAGGAVVDATFTPNVPITGGFTAYQLYSNSGQSNGANLGIGTIADPNDQILQNVTTFDGGTASFHNTAGTIANGAVVVAEYTTGEPLIIKQENVGPAAARRTFLNFYPPSIDVRDDFWDSASDGARIMINAILWTFDPSILSTDDNALGLSISVYPNPAQDQLTIANSSGLFIEKAEIIDALGRIVQVVEVNDTTSKTLNISSLTSGVYFLQLSGNNNTGVTKFIKK